MINTVQNIDCLIGMQNVSGKSIDMILCDLPYGTTQNKWDVIIPFAPLWEQYERIIKDNGAIVLTAAQPFTSMLVMSNPKLFRYDLVWEKSSPTGFLDAQKKPLRCHESILIFYKKQPAYNPQKWQIDPIFIDRRKTFTVIPDNTSVYGFHKDKAKKKDDGQRLPLSVIPAKSFWSKGMHSNQKPVALFEYLIKTYSNESETILDNCIGSGTTAIACMNTNRNYIGFENDEKYFKVAQERINKHTPQLKLIA